MNLDKTTEFINKIRSVNKKIIVAGDGAAGRTTLLTRYTENYFNPETRITIGLQIFTKSLNIDNKNIKFIFWVLAGQERWRFFQPDFFKGADGAILAFDLTRARLLNNIGGWVNILRSWNQDLPIIFIGMKYDLKDSIEVPDEYGLELAEEYKFIEFIKVSCKTGENVHKSFQSLFSHILKIPREKIPIIRYVDERTKKIERMLQVSNRIELEMMRSALNMEKKEFNIKVFEWAKEFGFTIDKDILIVDKDTISDYITNLETMFETWEKSKTKKLI